MLFGEHAVLRGHAALVAAIDQWLTVEIHPQHTAIIEIDSNLGHASVSIEELKHKKYKFPQQFSFFEACLNVIGEYSDVGFTCHVTSQFSSHVGLGSSAAFVVAFLAAYSDAAELHWDHYTLHQKALEVIRLVQGRGSGADIAASIFGGIIEYSYSGIERVADALPLVVLYSGYKTPTPAVIKHVDELEKESPQLVKALMTAMGELTGRAKASLIANNLHQLGIVANCAAGVMEGLTLACPKIRALLHLLREQEAILGAKISGSGLGDCVIGFGAVDTLVLPEWAEQLPLKVSDRGVLVNG